MDVPQAGLPSGMLFDERLVPNFHRRRNPTDVSKPCAVSVHAFAQRLFLSPGPSAVFMRWYPCRFPSAAFMGIPAPLNPSTKRNHTFSPTSITHLRRPAPSKKYPKHIRRQLLTVHQNTKGVLDTANHVSVLWFAPTESSETR